MRRRKCRGPQLRLRATQPVDDEDDDGENEEDVYQAVHGKEEHAEEPDGEDDEEEAARGHAARAHGLDGGTMTGSAPGRTAISIGSAPAGSPSR